jgi:hypothetical protein
MSNASLTAATPATTGAPPPTPTASLAARLEGRAALIANWSWELVVSFNRGACDRGCTRQALNPESYETVRQRWEQSRQRQVSLVEALDFLLECHKWEPFVFFSGPTFAEVARRIVDVTLAGLALDRRREAVQLAAEFVEANIERDALLQGLAELCEIVHLQPGDRVRTLKGSRRGVVRRVLADGRVSWRPDGGAVELIALPESLLREGSIGR